MSPPAPGAEPGSNHAEDPVEAAWQALERGDPAAALAALAGAGDGEGDGERFVVEVHARLDAGELALAERALRLAGERLPADDPLLVAAAAECDLARWDAPAARAKLERLAAAGEDAGVLERLALCADLEGDFEAADALFAEAAALEPDAAPVPRLSAREFEAVVAAAAGELPEAFRAALEEIPVVIDPMPSRELAGGGGPDGLPPELLGLFVGRSALERSHEDSGELPPAIFLFQRNLERACRNRTELCEEIRVTLYHELGHALGFDEEGVEEMGLG